MAYRRSVWLVPWLRSVQGYMTVKAVMVLWYWKEVAEQKAMVQLDPAASRTRRLLIITIESPGQLI
jgi:hypothetical protein